MKHMILAALLLSTPAGALAQTISAENGTGYSYKLASPVINGQSGECRCFANGKEWACRKAKGDPLGMVQTVNRCHGGGSQLVCPEDKGAVCEYRLFPPICSEPPLSNVCYAGDEPK